MNKIIFTCVLSCAVTFFMCYLYVLFFFTSPIKNNCGVEVEKGNIVAIDERMNSLNKRFDDFYLLGGTIVVLLLAIVAGSYVRSEDQVKKYFADNFEGHQKKLDDILTKAGQTLQRIDKIREQAEGPNSSISLDNNQE